MVTTTELRRFAFRQGAGRTLLGLRNAIDDQAATTSLLPPAGCRGGSGRVLPFGTTALLDGAHYPAGRVAEDDAENELDPAAVLGHVLLAAFGIQRREPSSRYNDHRVVASVRSKFPVHCFVQDEHGLAYLDLYRHALVDVEQSVPAGSRPGCVTVVLAARYTDFPVDYGWLRGSLADLELGINLRSLFVAAELFGVRATLELDGDRAREIAELIAGTGSGQWTPPLLVMLETAPVSRGEPLPGGGTADSPAEDGLLTVDAGLRDSARIAATMYGIPVVPAAPAPGLPVIARRDPTSWAQVLWNRSAGRVPAGLQGFSSVAARFGQYVLDDHCAAVATAPPSPLLAAVVDRVRISLALQRVGDRPAGVYRLGPDGLSQVRTDPAVMSTIESAFSYPTAKDTDSCVRHAGLVWLMSADLAALAEEFGPASWTLLQLACGWMSHGLSVAAAAHGQFARPVRSFDENKVITCFELPWQEMPTFMVIAGRSRFAEPMLDLRT